MEFLAIKKSKVVVTRRRDKKKLILEVDNTPYDGKIGIKTFQYGSFGCYASKNSKVNTALFLLGVCEKFGKYISGEYRELPTETYAQLRNYHLAYASTRVTLHNKHKSNKIYDFICEPRYQIETQDGVNYTLRVSEYNGTIRIRQTSELFDYKIKVEEE